MSAVGPTTSSNYWSYLNPLNLLKLPSYVYGAVASVFANKPQPLASLAGRQLVVYRHVEVDDEKQGGGTILVEEDRYESLAAYLDRTSRPYPIQEIILDDGTKLDVAKTFVTDIGRSGEPDQFFIDGEEIKPVPKTEQQIKDLLAKMLKIANGDRLAVKRWTETWNYRLKVDLQNTVMQAFNDKYNLKPIFGRHGFDKVIISLNTKEQVLTCEVSGKVQSAIDDNPELEMPDIREGLNIRYSAGFSFDSAGEWLENRIIFTD